MEMDHIRNVPRGLVMDMYKCILWLWRISRSVRIRVALSGMAGILRMCISLLFVWVSKRLVDIATGHIDEGFSLYIMLMGGCIVAQLALSIIRERLDSLNTVCLKNELRHYFFYTSDAKSVVRKRTISYGRYGEPFAGGCKGCVRTCLCVYLIYVCYRYTVGWRFYFYDVVGQ